MGKIWRDFGHAFSCLLYTSIESKGITLLSPVFDLDFGQEAMASAMLGLSKILGIPKPFCAKALLLSLIHI